MTGCGATLEWVKGGRKGGAACVNDKPHDRKSTTRGCVWNRTTYEEGVAARQAGKSLEEALADYQGAYPAAFEAGWRRT